MSLRSPIVRSGLVALMVACGLAVSDLADAQQPSAQERSQPVLLNADTVTFDEQLGLVTATGNVELAQGQRSVRADTITYNQKSKVVTASGNVRMVEPSGDIFFSDYAELTDDMRDAFVNNVRVLMTDNSRMAGNEGERREGRLTRVNRGVYSPCELCKSDPLEPPLWQVRAVRIVHDNQEHEVRYKNAYLELFGVPVAYTPYLSHPDPTVDRRSGFLTPSFRNNSELGFGVVGHYYYDIAPDQDATFSLGGYSSQGPIAGAQYRKRFENGSLQLDGAIAQGELQNGSITGSKDNRTRGFAFARGLFDINETWRWGFDVRRASDEYFLRRYYDIRDDVLTSRAYVEGFDGRNYAAVNAYSFQDLRYGNPVPTPIAAPDARYNALGEPGSLLGGRWSFDSSLLAVSRTSNNGPQTQRVKVQPGWEREFISSTGLVTNLSGSVLLAGYTASQFNPSNPTATGKNTFDGVRAFPQAQATFRYPFIRYGQSSHQTIEPLGQLTVAPKMGNDKVFPNEDSLDVEFDQSNLFTPNRFTGIDRLDSGSRVTYGLRGTIQGYTAGGAALFVGQSIRLTDTSAFQGGSGLEKHKSDYVGNLNLTPASWMDINYGFRIDEETLTARRHSVNATLGVPELNVSTAYTYVDQTQNRYAIQRDKVEQAIFGIGSQFATRWGVSLSHVQAMRPQPGARASLATLTYSDECFIFQTIARRDYTTTVNGQSDGNTLFFRFVFKNIGEFRSPGINSGFLGGGTGSTH